MFVVERLLSVVAPHRCIVCADEGGVVCSWCLPDLAPPLPDRCFRCQTATPSSVVCAACRRSVKLKHVWVRTLYEGQVKQLIHDFKFERKQAAAPLMARLMAESLPYLPPSTIVTHVPTASSRIRQRGYDHARLLAKALAKEVGLSYSPVLARLGQARQVGAKRQTRLSQLEGVFRVTKPEIVQKAAIVVVDDIVTTGATLTAVARCLKDSGANVVDAVVFAQKQ